MTPSAEPAPLNLLALPCAGASAALYARWRRLLPPWIRVVPVELPGRGSRLDEKPVTDYTTLVARLCEEHAQLLRTRHALFGHSMGALLAYGMARHLRAQDGPLPQALCVAASPAPARRNPWRLAGLDHDAALVAQLRRQGGTPDEAFRNPELLRLTLDALGADYRVCASFRHAAQAPLPMPIHAFAGRQDDIAPDDVAAWSSETAGHFSLAWFDGGHFFVREHEGAMLETLVRELRGPAPAATPAIPAMVAQALCENTR